MGEVEVHRHAFFTFVLDGGEWPASCLAALPPRNECQHPMDRRLGRHQGQNGNPAYWVLQCEVCECLSSSLLGKQMLEWSCYTWSHKSQEHTVTHILTSTFISHDVAPPTTPVHRAIRVEQQTIWASSCNQHNSTCEQWSTQLTEMYEYLLLVLMVKNERKLSSWFL